MPSPDRTTVKATIAELIGRLRANLVGETPTAPLRRVEIGSSGEYPRPFLTVGLARTRPISATDDDKLVEVTVTLRLATDVTEVDPHGSLLDKVAAVDDYLDSVRDTGVIEGAEGFDDRVWTFDYPRTTAGARMAWATATQSFVAKVEREQNREPSS